MTNDEMDDLAARLQREWDDDTWISLWDATKSKRRLARRDVWIRGWDDQDKDAVMELATWKCLKTWRRGEGDCFLTWCVRSWRCSLLNILRAESTTWRRRVLTESVELTPEMSETMAEMPADDTEEALQALRARLAVLMPFLTPEQRQVLGYRVCGLEYSQIAERTGMSVKRVDNLLMKIRRRAKGMGTGTWT